MATETSKTTSPGSASPTPQQIPLAQIRDLPGIVNIRTYTPKDLGGLVSSIQSVGVREPIIVRHSEDGTYQLLAGQRRRKASELAKKTTIPALVYEMTLEEARTYHKAQTLDPKTVIPGKPVTLSAGEPSKAEEKPSPSVPAVDKDKQNEKPASIAPTKSEPIKAEEKPSAVPAATDKGKEAEKSAPVAPAKSEAVKVEEKPAVAPAEADKSKKAEKPTPTATTKGEATKMEEKPSAAPAVAGKDNETEKPVPAAPAKSEPAKAEEKPSAAPAVADKGKEAEKSAPAASTKAAPAKPAAMPAGPAAVGPTGTAITQVFEARLNPPDEKTLKDLPIPKEGESYFITLHPAYLERSKYNNFSVDKDSDNFKELYKAVELAGIKDPVLARPKEGGGLEILSGQRRHLIGTELNYPIPTIIQRIDDADAKILVADSNLHRDKISTYDLSRALKMKMEGMKQKAGRKKKGELGEKLNTDEAIAKEMGITVSKFNRMLRMSEATKDVCSKVDDGTLALSIASALSFLKPKNQDMAVRLSDLGYRLSTERVEYLKRVEKVGRLTEDAMRKVLEGENILDPPKVVPLPVKQEKNSPAAVQPAPQVAATAPSPSPVIPSSPDVAVPPAHVVPTTAVPVSVVNRDASSGTVPEQEDDPFKGKQERAENTKVILSGDRLRKYYPDVSMTPREIEEDIYGKLERCRQMDEKQKAKDSIFKKGSTQQR